MNSGLDRLLGKAKSAADAAGKKAEGMVELSKCKLQAIQLGSSIQEQYNKLGSAVYSMTKDEYDNPELVSAIVEEIDRLIERLNEVEEKLAALKKRVKCPCCGENNADTAQYCSQCGCKLGREKAETAEATETAVELEAEKESDDIE